MQDAKSLVEPCAWENVACPGEWPGHPFSEARHPGLPPHHLSVHASHDDTTRGVDLVPIQVFTQETQREHLAFASSYAFQTLGHFILVGSILRV